MCCNILLLFHMFVQPDHTTLNEQDKASKQASQPACVCAWQKVIVIGQQLLFIKMPEKGERRCHVKKNTTFVEANGPAPPHSLLLLASPPRERKVSKLCTIMDMQFGIIASCAFFVSISFVGSMIARSSNLNILGNEFYYDGALVTPHLCGRGSYRSWGAY